MTTEAPVTDTATATPPQPLRLNLGCGNKRKPGFLGVDRYPCEAADMLADLSQRLPFATSSVAEVWSDNVIEHIPDLTAFMAEVHRVCMDGARVTLITPHFTSASSWRDPTHVHHLSYFSMHHFAKAGVAHYTGGGYEVERVKLSFGGGLGLIGRLICAISPRAYEDKWCFLFRASTLTYHLVVRKPAMAGVGGTGAA